MKGVLYVKQVYISHDFFNVLQYDVKKHEACIFIATALMYIPVFLPDNMVMIVFGERKPYKKCPSF
jgi:hypothetical protein